MKRGCGAHWTNVFGKSVFILLLSISVLFSTGLSAFAKAYIRVGLLGEPKNLNPFQTSDSWTKKVIRLIYQPLYVLDPGTMKLVPWLAKDQPKYDPNEMSLTFELRQMQWDDGSTFSAEDVVFTAEIFRQFRVPRYYAYWEFVRSIEALDRRTVKITLNRPMASLYTRILSSWIVQKKRWEPIVRNAEKTLRKTIEKTKANDKTYDFALKKALRVIQNHLVAQPVGLGPFRFEEWRKGTYILLLKNGRFFGQNKIVAGKKLGPYIDRFIFKIYDKLGAATLALKAGDIDFLWKGVSQALVKDLVQEPNLGVSMTLDSGYRYLGFNLRKPPMSDLAFRQALAHLIDKDFILNRILHDHGQRLDSFIPPSNAFYYNNDTLQYGTGLDRNMRTRKAYSILTNAGYRWKRQPLGPNGSTQKGDGFAMPDGKPAPPMTIITPSAEYDTEMAAAGRIIKEWLEEFGIPVSWKTMPFRSLTKKIRVERDFDMFIMGWRNLSIDPDYLRRFFHSSYDSPNMWNYTGYKNAEYDGMADLQAKTVDLKERRSIILRLQKMLMADLPYIPLYVPHLMEGVRTDRFVGWVKQLGGVGNIWSFSLLRPTKIWDKNHPLHK